MSIFKAYDIRGIYGKDLTEKIMEKIGMAVGTYSPGNFTVGRDFRSHGKKLEDAFVSGLMKTGSNVELVGKGPTILPVFENWLQKNDIAAYITGSHLTAEWNGIKFFRQDGVGFFENENKKLEQIVLSGKFKISEKQGVIKKNKNVENSYIKFIKERIKTQKIKVVIDFGNGAACLIVPKIIKALGNVNAKYIFNKPDPRFKNRSPEPDDNSLSKLKKTVKKEKADLGIGFDGDGDRAMFVDDKGNFMLPEVSSIIFIRDIMKSQRGPVIANIECSSIIDKEVKKFNQHVIRIPVGHTFLVQEAKNNNAVFGIEKSGHVCIPKFYWFDDAIINSMYMIEIVSKLNKKVSELIKKVPKIIFKRLQADCPDDIKFKVMKNLKQKFIKKYKNVNIMDGIRIDFSDSWILIRPSNTSPLIRLSIETKNKKRFGELTEEFYETLKEEISKQI